MQQFQFDLVSPEKQLISKAVAMVTVPGGEGDYGVLAGHAPMITTVRPGVLAIYGEDDTTITERLFVAGGFAEVTANRCAILAEEAIPVAELHHAQLEVQVTELREELAAADTDEARTLLESRLNVLNAKLLASQSSR